MPTTGLSPQLHIYLNLVLSYWEMLFLVGEMPDSVLIEYAKGDFFGTQAGRQYWEGTREYRLAMAKNRASRRFIQVIDSAWQQLAPLEPPAPTTDASPPRRNVQAAAVGATATAAVALMIIWLTRSKKGPTNT
ncbi:hypothetical protein SAMN05421874_12462 [Nonomuraea maritima]|uniref:Uncharacterized protein n=2 Tax=Nonomuraea maritima TaxID=683260 RepID=A0A1G9L900_9ACTN|nr:hypothetical protein SAMN05421874_12462 [Nonomuraea maritima]